MLTPTQVPYTGPYASTQTKLPSAGPTVLALKMAMRNLGLLGSDAVMDEVWRGALDTAFRKWQRSVDLPGNGVYAEQAWKKLRAAKTGAGRYALGTEARALIVRDYAEQRAEAELEKLAKIRAAITDFCLKAEANEDAWHYSQARPIDVSVNPSASYVRSDCSGYVIQSYYAARVKTGLNVPDPAKQGWSGYGNTREYEDDHPTVGNGQYLVGDLAHYGVSSSSHVALCRRAGTSSTAVWSSHGTEAGPVPVSLFYGPPLLKVVRPPLLA